MDMLIADYHLFDEYDHHISFTCQTSNNVANAH